MGCCVLNYDGVPLAVPNTWEDCPWQDFAERDPLGSQLAHNRNTSSHETRCYDLYRGSGLQGSAVFGYNKFTPIETARWVRYCAFKSLCLFWLLWASFSLGTLYCDCCQLRWILLRRFFSDAWMRAPHEMSARLHLMSGFPLEGDLCGAKRQTRFIWTFRPSQQNGLSPLNQRLIAAISTFITDAVSPTSTNYKHPSGYLIFLQTHTHYCQQTAKFLREFRLSQPQHHTHNLFFIYLNKNTFNAYACQQPRISTRPLSRWK